MEIITNIVTSELSCNRSMNSFLNSAEFIQCKYGDETVCIIRMNFPHKTTNCSNTDCSLLQQILSRNPDTFLSLWFKFHSPTLLFLHILSIEKTDMHECKVVDSIDLLLISNNLWAIF